MPAAAILSTASYLPPRRVTQEDFARRGISQEQLEKFGIHEHRVAEGETATDMETKAGRIALERAGVRPSEIELIIGVTTLAEKINPPNVMLTQHKLGATQAACFGVDMSCGGSIPAMMVANAFVRQGMYSKILLVASCCGQRALDPTDDFSVVVIGDGASAVVVGAVDEGESGFVASELQANGRFWTHCGVETRRPKDSQRAPNAGPGLYFYIDEVQPEPGSDPKGCSPFNRYVIESVPRCARRLLDKQGIEVADIDWVVPHQNVQAVSGAWLRLLGVPPEKAILTNREYGNIGAANIWLNLDHAAGRGMLKEGDLILTLGQGSGFAVGSMLLRWNALANRAYLAAAKR